MDCIIIVEDKRWCGWACARAGGGGGGGGGGVVVRGEVCK